MIKMVFLHGNVARLLLLLLIAGISSYVADAGRRSSWPTIDSRFAARYTIPTRRRWKPCSERYSIQRCLWQGHRFASVYKARDTKKSNALVVIKAFKVVGKYYQEAMAFNRIAERKRIYEAERVESAAASASVDASPWKHLVQLLDRCHHNGQPALVIEYLDQVLTDSIRLKPMTVTPPQSERGQVGATSFVFALPPRQLVIPHPARRFKWYSYQLLLAVDVLHEAGMAHFDLKPSNIGLTPDNTLKVFDFEFVSSFVPSRCVGTMEYSAPEMNLAVNNIAKGDKMDIWSVGCIIFEIFMGGQLLPGIRAFADFNRRSSLASPNVDCDVRAAYFYIIWGFGLRTFRRYRPSEELARSQCPQIFSERSKQMLLKYSPRVFVFAFSQAVSNKKLVDSVIALQGKQLGNPDSMENYMRLEPSFTSGKEVLSLLHHMIDLNYETRHSAHYLRTDPMFDEFRN